MAFGSMDDAGESAPMAEINMIPLIDVMLVLLVIFIITAPLLAHSVRIDLPKASSEPVQTRRETVQLGIKASGEMYWNTDPVDRSTLQSRLLRSAAMQPQPEVHIRADSTAQYQRVAEVLSDAARAGVTRIGFITDPETRK